MAINEYAELVGFSTPSISMVLNGHQPGSIKMVQACAIKAGKNIQDYLWVIESPEEEDERKALRAFKVLNQKNRELALRILLNFGTGQVALEKPLRRKRS